MHSCCKLFWALSLIAIIFFVYMIILLITQPQFFPFPEDHKHANITTCLNVAVLYLVVFLLISYLWRKQIKNQKKQEEIKYINPTQQRLHS